MATPQAVSAVVRASRPNFSCATDKAVFAVHAILSVNGLSLRKLGDETDAAAAQGPSALPAEEIPLDGWNASTDLYALLYAPQEQQQQQQLLLVKCLPVDGSVLVTLAEVVSGQEPVSLELQLDRYVPEAAASASAPGLGLGFSNLDELIKRVEIALGEALPAKDDKSTQDKAVTAGKAGSTTAGTSQQDTAAAERERERQRERERERERERSPGHDPLRDDRFPGRAPGLPPGWGGPGLVPPVGGGGPGGLFLPDGGLEGPGSMGPLGGGGGMHVGPGHPFFADRMRHPDLRPGGGLGFPAAPGRGPAPGVRWDPINPEGLQGWNPEDFQRGGRSVREDGLNDIGRPAPGRGPDWDHMFG